MILCDSILPKLRPKAMYVERNLRAVVFRMSWMCMIWVHEWASFCSVCIYKCLRQGSSLIHSHKEADY